MVKLFFGIRCLNSLRAGATETKYYFAVYSFCPVDLFVRGSLKELGTARLKVANGNSTKIGVGRVRVTENVDHSSVDRRQDSPDDRPHGL